MVGMFGGDAVERKYGKLPPAEWKAMLSRLKDFEIDRGVRRLAFSGKQHVPTLPEFTKLCRMVADDDIDEGPQRLALPAPTTWQGDAWDIESNQRLWKFLTVTLTARSNALGKVLPCERVLHRRTGEFLHLRSQASDEQTWSTEVLVGYKKAWAQDMREYAADHDGKLPATEYRQRTWDECMTRAMTEIRQRISQ